MGRYSIVLVDSSYSCQTNAERRRRDIGKQERVRGKEGQGRERKKDREKVDRGEGRETNEYKSGRER